MYRATVIRVQFSDHTTLQGTFHPEERIADVHVWLKSCFAPTAVDVPFFLFTRCVAAAARTSACVASSSSSLPPLPPPVHATSSQRRVVCSPPMTVLSEASTLASLRLVPAARVYLSWGTKETRAKSGPIAGADVVQHPPHTPTRGVRHCNCLLCLPDCSGGLPLSGASARALALARRQCAVSAHPCGHASRYAPHSLSPSRSSSSSVVAAAHASVALCAVPTEVAPPVDAPPAAAAAPTVPKKAGGGPKWLKL